MSLEQPFFCPRFSRDDYVSTSVLRRSFKWGVRYGAAHYEPVLLHPGGDTWRTDHQYVLGCSGWHAGHEYETMIFQTAKWAFARKVYETALRETSEKFPLEQPPSWGEGYANWRFLTLPAWFSDASVFLMERARQACETRSIEVKTGCVYYEPMEQPDMPPARHGNRGTVTIVMDAEILSDEIMKPLHEKNRPDMNVLVPSRPMRFDWDEIAALFHAPTLREVELLNYHDARPPASDLDLAMIKCAANLDIDGALELARKGANINAFDEHGETALTSVSEAWKNKPDAPFNQEQRIAALSALLEAGASINLTFYEESDALINATLNAEPKTVRFLLDRGADPNFNPWPEENPDDISQALDYASTNAWLERGTPNGDAWAEIEEMLKNAGAVLRKNP